MGARVRNEHDYDICYWRYRIGQIDLMRFFEAKGAGVVYADEVGHENLHNAVMKDELRAAFGNKIFDSEGEIIRSELAACAFSSPQNTALLDSITQPRLYEGCLRHIGDLGRAMRWLCSKWPFLTGAMTFYQKADIVIAVTTSPEVRIARLMQSRGFSKRMRAIVWRIRFLKSSVCRLLMWCLPITVLLRNLNRRFPYGGNMKLHHALRDKRVRLAGARYQLAFCLS